MSAVAVEKENPELTLKAVIIFDSRPLAARAITSLENAAVGAGEGIEWDIKSWQAEILKRSDLAGITVAVAADADLIILALEKMDGAPIELLDWLERWSEHSRIEDAAVMAIYSDDSPPPFLNELKWFAEWRGLNFLESRDAPVPENVVRLGHLKPSANAPAMTPNPAR